MILGKTWKHKLLHFNVNGYYAGGKILDFMLWGQQKNMTVCI